MIFRDQEQFDKACRRLALLTWVGRVSYLGLIAGLLLWLPVWHAVGMVILSMGALVGMQAATTQGHLSGMAELSNVVRGLHKIVERVIEEGRLNKHE